MFGLLYSETSILFRLERDPSQFGNLYYLARIALYTMGGSVSVNSFSDVKVRQAVVVQVRPSGYILVMQHDGAREAFVEFLTAGAWLPRLAVEHLTKKNRKTLYFHSLKEKNTAEEVMGATDCQDEEESLIDAVMRRPQKFSVLFPLFLSSPHYEKWVISSISGNASCLNIAATDLDICDSTKHPLSRSLDEALISADWEELPFMRSHGGEWLRKFISSVDTLPLSVSLTTARASRPGYPLVYVNCAFLKLTGYSRTEVIGCSNNLHIKYTDSVIAQLLDDALSLATPVKTTIRCARKDGAQYASHFAMKPIFDSHGQYAYVISVQCDSSASAKMLACVEALLFVLPNVLA